VARIAWTPSLVAGVTLGLVIPFVVTGYALGVVWNDFILGYVVAALAYGAALLYARFYITSRVAAAKRRKAAEDSRPRGP